MNNWYKTVVKKGHGIGKKIGFPTVNLDTKIIPAGFQEGVYAGLVKYKNKIYKGALYFGPRLFFGEKIKVLEIHILDFDKDIYEETIEFQIKDFIRGVMNFASQEDFVKQLKKDVEEVIQSLL